jgi:hypothetical protein
LFANLFGVLIVGFIAVLFYKDRKKQKRRYLNYKQTKQKHKEQVELEREKHRRSLWPWF